MFGSPKMLIWFTLAAAVIVGAIIALATGKWWTLLIPLAVHALGTTAVTLGLFRVLDESDKPDPVTQARLDEEQRSGATS